MRIIVILKKGCLITTLYLLWRRGKNKEKNRRLPQRYFKRHFNVIPQDVARVIGIEPILTESKSVVLPLDDTLIYGGVIPPY